MSLTGHRFDPIAIDRRQRPVGEYCRPTGIVEQHDVLTDQGNLAAQRLKIKITDRNVVDQNTTAIRKIEARNQIEPSVLFTRAGTPDQGSDRPRLQGQIDLIQNQTLGIRIAKRNRFENHSAMQTLRRNRSRIRLGRRIEYGKDTVRPQPALSRSPHAFGSGASNGGMQATMAASTDMKIPAVTSAFM